MRPRERGAAGRRTPDQTAEDGNNDTAIIAPKVDFSNQMVADACIGDVAVHPLAGLFPMMTDAEIDRLAADIRAVGQREPIVMYKGSVLDGRNRLEACRRLGHSPLRTEYEGVESDIASFVVSLNLHRRHLDESQRAMVAARLATLERGTNQHAPIGAPVTQDAAADMLSVGRRSVQRARAVIDSVDVVRIALLKDDLPGLPHFDAATKAGDARHRWYVNRYGSRCWELDAMPPPLLRERVRSEIWQYIDADAWNRAIEVEAVEVESMRTFHAEWNSRLSGSASI